MSRLTIQFPQSRASAKPLSIPIIVISKGDTAVVIVGGSALWKHHYQQAIDNGNRHEAAARFADLMAR